MNKFQAISAQVGAATVAVGLLYVIASAALDRDVLVEEVKRESGARTRSVGVIGGVLSSSGDEARFATTYEANVYDPSRPYRELVPSMNRVGGAQFTYAFWMKVTPGEYERTILLRGDPTRVDFTPRASPQGATVSHPAAFCPMIRVKVRKNGDVQIVAHANTSSELNVKTVRSVDNGSPFDMTRYQLVCVSFEDGRIYDAVDGTSCTVWVNQTSTRKHSRAATLRENRGDLYVFPRLAGGGGGAAGPLRLPADSAYDAGKVTIRNLSYHNYSFSADDVNAKLKGEADASGAVQYAHEGASAAMERTREFTDLSMQMHDR